VNPQEACLEALDDAIYADSEYIAAKQRYMSHPATAKRVESARQRIRDFEAAKLWVNGAADGEVKCKDHPDAPHGFARSASHSAGRYVCECESWEPDGEAAK